MSRLLSHAALALAAGCLLVCDGAPLAAGRVEIRAAGLQHAGWHADSATATLELRGERPALQLDLRRFTAARLEASSLSFECAGLALDGPAAACETGTLRAVSPGLPTLTEPLSIDYRPASDTLDLSASGRLLDMRWRLALHQTAHDRTLRLDLAGDGSAVVSRLLVPMGLWPAGWPAPAPGHHLQAEASLHGRAGTHGSATLAVERLDFASEDGLRAGEELSAHIKLRGQRDGPIDHQGWAMTGEAAADVGALYLHPLFLDFSAEPISLSATARITDRHWCLRSAQARQQGLTLEATDLLWRPEGGLRSGALEARAMDAHYLLERYLAPWAPAAFESLALQGTVSARAQWRDGALAGAGLSSDSLSLRREPGQQALQQCAIDVRWQMQAAEPVHLACAGGRVGRIPFGAFAAEGRLGPDGLHIPRLRVPLLEGTARFDDIRVAHDHAAPGNDPRGSVVDSLRGATGLQLSGLSLPALSTALGWPEIGGQLDARLPRLDLRGDDLRLHGELELELLGGHAWLEQIAIEDLLGTVPELRGNLELRGLDLEQLTRAFSFGSISGRVDGYIRNLHLERWQPVAFDAALYSTPGDRSPHRISQRAIENLSSLGGASGALQGGLLRFFDQFRYRRLGIHCTLRRSVCLLGGIEPAGEDSYYIVQPGGLWPRISVIGHERLVDWPVLLRRLQRVTRSGPAAAAPPTTTDG